MIDIKPLNLPEAALLVFNKPVDWMIFISANAVNFALAGNNGKIRHACLQAKVIAVGEATAQALRQAGVTVSIVPQQGFNSEALLASPELQQLSKQHCVIVRGVGGRALLGDTLRMRGAQVDYLEVYERQSPTIEPARLRLLLQSQALDIITVTSAESMQNLLALVPEAPWRNLLYALPLVVISERLGLMAESLGFRNVVVSDGVSDQAVFKTIINLASGENSG